MQVIQAIREAIEARHRGAMEALAIVEKYLREPAPLAPELTASHAASGDDPPAVASVATISQRSLTVTNAIHAHLADGKEQTASEIAEALGISGSKVHTSLGNNRHRFNRRRINGFYHYRLKGTPIPTDAPEESQNVPAEAKDEEQETSQAPVAQQVESPPQATKTFRQIVFDYLADGKEAATAEIAEATGITERQVQGVVSNCIDRFNRRYDAKLAHSIYKLRPAGEPQAAAPDPSVPPPGPASIPQGPKPVVDETDEAALERIYAKVQDWGVARPRGLSLELGIEQERVERLLQHEWFERTPHGYKIRRATEGSR